jgi:hypothetical protein
MGCASSTEVSVGGTHLGLSCEHGREKGSSSWYFYVFFMEFLLDCYGSHGSRTEKEKVGRGLPGPASPAASNVRSADLRVRPQRPGCGALCRVRRRQRSDAGTTRWIRSSPKRQSGVSICSSYSTQWSQRRPNYSRAGPGWSSECHCHSRRIRAWLNLYCRVCTGRRDVSSRQDQRSSSLLRTDSKYQYRRRQYRRRRICDFVRKP